MTVLDIRFNDLAAVALGPADALPLDRLAPGQREMIAKAAPVPVRCVVGANSTNGRSGSTVPGRGSPGFTTTWTPIVWRR
ncbi:hypothetical protein SAMN04489733_1573 [Amycolatopsis keratiniphila]|nr:hypothetical protein SAMN04489733_1573 [Amycolatopsis keratiniphila]